MAGSGKSQARKEFWNPSEQAHASDFVFGCLREKRLHQATSASATLAGGINRNRANFGKVGPVEMESAATDDATVVLQHNKIAHVLADFGQ